MTPRRRQHVILSEVDNRLKEYLIDEVRQFELVYDKKNQHYRNRTRIITAWANIAANLQASTKLQVSPEYCKAVWQALCNAFGNADRRQRRKIGEAAAHEPTWKFYRRMLFLKEFEYQHPCVSDTVSAEDGAPTEAKHAEWAESVDHEVVIADEPATDAFEQDAAALAHSATCFSQPVFCTPPQTANASATMLSSWSNASSSYAALPLTEAPTQLLLMASNSVQAAREPQSPASWASVAADGRLPVPRMPLRNCANGAVQVIRITHDSPRDEWDGFGIYVAGSLRTMSRGAAAESAIKIAELLANARQGC